MVRTLRSELGHEHGTVKRVAEQLGYGVESVWVRARQADIDDCHAPGVSTAQAARVRDREQEVRELSRVSGTHTLGRLRQYRSNHGTGQHLFGCVSAARATEPGLWASPLGSVGEPL
jgi:hypothetical protein